MSLGRRTRERGGRMPGAAAKSRQATTGGPPMPAGRGEKIMRRDIIIGGGLAAIAAIFAITAAQAADPASCKKVRFSDVGWTDITATTALTSRVLTGLGYEPSATILAVPVTY